MPWSTKRALQVYRTVFPEDPIHIEDNDPRQDSIVQEMNGVKFAPTAEEGATHIEWWGWDDEFTALDAAKRIRRFK